MKSTTPKPFVFVLMPFAPEFDDVYKLGIKPACENAGAYAERLDEQMFTENMLDRIYNQISKADVIVSDMSGRNPNVFYETGYAHALGKKVILVTKTSDDIPFDLKHYPHIIYGGRIADLGDKLTKRIAWAITRTDDVVASELVQCYINGHRLPNSQPIDTLFENSFLHERNYIKVDVHNSVDRLVRTARIKWGILIDEDKNDLVILSYTMETFNRIRQPDNKTLSIAAKGMTLHPDAWKSFSIHLCRQDGTEAKSGDLFEATIRLFSDSGATDIPFSIRVVTV